MNKEYFMRKLKCLLTKLDFDDDVKVEALNYISNEYTIISKMAEKAMEDWENYLINLKNPYTGFMILIYKIVDLDVMYKEKELPEDVFLDTLSDLILRQKMYFKQYNQLGLSEEDMCWLKHIYYLNIFKLGALQYEIANMSYLECPDDIGLDETKKRLPEGSPIFKIHIRRNVDLSEEEVDKSFDLSKQFFKTYYPEYEYLAYTCNSWMLYSKNSLLLSPQSNILNFSNRFELICETQRKDMAIKYIFGRDYENIEDYPQETSLQRNALKHLDILGVGYGVIYI